MYLNLHSKNKQLKRLLKYLHTSQYISIYDFMYTYSTYYVIGKTKSRNIDSNVFKLIYIIKLKFCSFLRDRIVVFTKN